MGIFAHLSNSMRLKRLLQLVRLAGAAVLLQRILTSPDLFKPRP